MASQAVIAVVAEQDLILQVPVRVILPVQTKMHGLYLAGGIDLFVFLSGLKECLNWNVNRSSGIKKERYIFDVGNNNQLLLLMLSPSVD